MAAMDESDYADMVELSPSSRCWSNIANRWRRTDARRLVGCCLTDRQGDGLSMIYSFFETQDESRPGLGNFIIMDHILRAPARPNAFVYLGYWVKGSPRMAYKTRYQPLEALTARGWAPLAGDSPTDRTAAGRNRDRGWRSLSRRSMLSHSYRQGEELGPKPDTALLRRLDQRDLTPRLADTAGRPQRPARPATRTWRSCG